jgi:hypothetical protein
MLASEYRLLSLHASSSLSIKLKKAGALEHPMIRDSGLMNLADPRSEVESQ